MRRSGVPDRVIMEITGYGTFECFRRYATIGIDDFLAAVGHAVDFKGREGGGILLRFYLAKHEQGMIKLRRTSPS